MYRVVTYCTWTWILFNVQLQYVFDFDGEGWEDGFGVLVGESCAAQALCNVCVYVCKYVGS